EMHEHLAETLHRTVKLEVDDRARSLEEAEEIARSHVLQIVVGEGVAGSPTAEALLLTALNVAPRAFVGGVRITAVDDPALNPSWGLGATLGSLVERYGCTPSRAVAREH